MALTVPSISLRRIWLRLILAAGLALAIAVGAASGQFQAAENSLRLVGFEMWQKQASGQIHIVEMDAASVEAIQQWPWSRSHYATVVDQLNAAGVRSIGFDVDFSSSSNPAADQEFANALARADAPVILPTFAQSESFQSERKLDALPIRPLREHAQLASVSIAPDADGFIRRMPLGTITAETPRPSLSAFFAGKAGIAGENFPIDYAINAASIPRHSFINIERGEFDADALRGKDVLIGATAIEMGDRYAVPRYGVIPGVVVQALATETLYSGLPIAGSWQLPLLLSVIFAVIILAASTYALAALRMAGSVVIILTASQYSNSAFGIWFEVTPSLMLALLAGALRALWIAREGYALAQRIDRETGLPNAIALQDHADQSEPTYIIAAMIGEFDTLKAVLGGPELPVLLQRVLDRLKLSSDASLVCRTDDRMLAWNSSLQLLEIEELLGSLRAIMLSPIEIGGRRVDVSLTFGVADATNDRAIVNAAHAASSAHRAGEAWQLHAADRSQHLEQQVSLLGELDEGLRNGDVKVFYQPKLDLSTNQITCAEALVRWEHPEKGMLPPDTFIPLAEESGRIEDLTVFVIKRAIEDMQNWEAQGLSMSTAVNVSARLLSTRTFMERAERLIDSMKIAPSRLTFEVTESAALEDWDASITALNRLRDRGIPISMDDYGTGQSTLSYLKTLPLSELKIDRSFVQHAHLDAGDAMLVRSTVQLAHALGLKVVAEGIEDAECLEFLRTIECDYAQGYFIGRPMKAEQLTDVISKPSGAAQLAA